MLYIYMPYDAVIIIIKQKYFYLYEHLLIKAQPRIFDKNWIPNLRNQLNSIPKNPFRITDWWILATQRRIIIHRRLILIAELVLNLKIYIRIESKNGSSTLLATSEVYDIHIFAESESKSAKMPMLGEFLRKKVLPVSQERKKMHINVRM